MKRGNGVVRLLAALGAIVGLVAACGESVHPLASDAPEALRQEVFGGDLGRAVGSPVATGTTCGKSNDFTPSCGNNSNAPNVVYTWTAPATDVYNFSTAGSSLDTVLEVRTYTSLVACNDDIFDVNGMSQQARVGGLELAAGTTVLVAIDSNGSNCGTYRLAITSSCPGGCNSPPPGGCYQSTGTCSNGTCQYAYKPAGASCSDGNACTVGDYCNGAGQCESDAVLSCDTAPDGCSLATGTCNPQWGCDYESRCRSTEICWDGEFCCIPNYAVSTSGDGPRSTASSREASGGVDAQEQLFRLCPSTNPY
jgi:hypothetical protein